MSILELMLIPFAFVIGVTSLLFEAVLRHTLSDLTLVAASVFAGAVMWLVVGIFLFRETPMIWGGSLKLFLIEALVVLVYRLIRRAIKLRRPVATGDGEATL